jgi:hypothetical protein
MLATLAGNTSGQLLLPFVLYSCGVVALFFVFRRSLRKQKLHKKEDDLCLRSRAQEAHRRIDGINEAQWMRKHRMAVKIQRDGTPIPEQARTFLAAVAERQRMKGGR